MAGEFTRRITGAAAVTTVMKSIGLVPPATIYDSLDKTAQQFWTLATVVGQQLIDEYEWQTLDREFEIITDGVTLEYPLPDDFNGFFEDAEWNRTSRLPMIGALNQQEWQLLKARDLGGTTLAVLYQIADDKVVFYSVGSVSSPQTLVLPYTSRAWVLAADGTTYRDNLSADDDVVRYDPQLFMAALKLAWLSAKKFDTTSALLEYNRCLIAAKGKDAPGRTLTLSRRSNYPLLGVLNIPETAYGFPP